MNSTKIKKTLIKLLPYIIVGLVCTNLGEAWRLAEGADMGKKMLSFFSMVGVAAGTALSTSEVDTADLTKYNMILWIAEGDYTYSRMADRSLRSSEVPLADLRYVKVLHYDHDGEIRVGELVVHKDILDDVTAIFAELFEKKYPINSMYLIDNYFGGETASAARERSAERDNTTCFCGGAGTAEGFGKAIVLNPGEGALEDAAAAVFRAHGFTRNGNRYEKMQ